MGNCKAGDIVVRKKYGGDVMFRIVDISQEEDGTELALLKGLFLRLMADAPLGDLCLVNQHEVNIQRIKTDVIHQDHVNAVLRRRGKRERSGWRSEPAEKKEKRLPFYDLPGRVLHVDGDQEYLELCVKTYQQMNMPVVGKLIPETQQPDVICDLISEHRPDILVLTGHDSLVGGTRAFADLDSYRHSKYFVTAVENARKMCYSKDELVIFAGACQSHYESLIAAGANFASSPQRIFIHCYDPVFVAEKIAFTPIAQTVAINDAITSSITGIDGVGGVETRGKFRLGLPKSPY
ncbi:MAG TPA: sporulation peptidase YabG [Firmicutes bacterium]|nr:sporulation peptidase YabG [Bacillota bacterium]